MPTSDRDFTCAMRAHQLKLYRTACFLTGDHHEGEDLLQETLLEAWKSWNSFEDRSSIYTWVYRILIHRYHRGNVGKHVGRCFCLHNTQTDKESQTFIDPSELPGSLMEHAEQNAQLWNLLATLRPRVPRSASPTVCRKHAPRTNSRRPAGATWNGEITDESRARPTRRKAQASGAVRNEL